MEARLLYIGSPTTNVEPVIQVTSGGKAVITSIRIAAPTNNNGTYELHHVAKGSTVANTTNAIAYNVQADSKKASEFLTHPLPLSPGEALWVSGSNVCIAVYGVTYP